MKLRQKAFISKSEGQTRAFGAEFAESLEKGGVIALYGDLGAGKTTFVQGLAEGLGIKKRIISPTFVIMRTYRLPNYSSREARISHSVRTIKNFYHVDLYRLEKRKQIEELGLRELMESPENLVVIEWAEKMKEYLPKERFDIYMKENGENKREIRIDRIQ